MHAYETCHGSLSESSEALFLVTVKCNDSKFTREVQSTAEEVDKSKTEETTPAESENGDNAENGEPAEKENGKETEVEEEETTAAATDDTGWYSVRVVLWLDVCD